MESSIGSSDIQGNQCAYITVNSRVLMLFKPNCMVSLDKKRLFDALRFLHFPPISQCLHPFSSLKVRITKGYDVPKERCVYNIPHAGSQIVVIVFDCLTVDVFFPRMTQFNAKRINFFIPIVHLVKDSLKRQFPLISV